jgi:hypothetical protein
MEALLFEQMKPSKEKGVYSSFPDLESIDSFRSYGSELSSASSKTADNSTVSLSSLKTHKRQRSGSHFKLHKSSPARHTRVAPIEAYTRKYGKKRSDSFNFEDIEAKEHPDPAAMVHPDCRLQKDKGRGEPLGRAISAEGQEGCLEKLRQKMKLLIEVSLGEDSKGPAGMKKRQAKVSEETAEYIETRSMIELRLGFLSMQYGILLRWDARSGKIVLVVRCTKDVTSAASGDPKYDREPCHIHRLGTEVVLIYPRFLISPKSLLLLYCLSRSTTLLIFQERVGGLSP